MSKKRTKKDKQQAIKHREATLAYSLKKVAASSKKSSAKTQLKPTQNLAIKLTAKSSTKKTFTNPTNFDNSLVIKDLLKTLLVTVLVVSALIAYTIFYK